MPARLDDINFHRDLARMERQARAEADDRAMPDILTKALAKPKVPRWARDNPAALASLERARQRRIERAERTMIVVPKGSSMKYGGVPTRKGIDFVR